MTKNPLVSIIMATYNADPGHLKESIQSILSQTYKNIEFIIVNDGSLINPINIINSFNDGRINYIDNKENLGLTRSLNIALEYCNGKYIARMDDDDISIQDRIEKQVKYFEGNSNANILGTNVKSFGTMNRYSNTTLASNREAQEISLLLGNNAVFHPTVMFRASFLKSNNIKYNEKYKKAQDYGIWVECVKFSKIDCLEEVLLNYRTHPNQISQKNRIEQLNYDDMIRIDQLLYLDMNLNETEINTHVAFCRMGLSLDIKDTEKWVEFLINYNQRTRIFNIKLFAKIIKKHWFSICYDRFIKHRELKFFLPLLKSLNVSVVSELLLNKIRSIGRLN